ncbi:hypothetical protein E2C01_047054 [Portunus trituberculatus]|uniref:Uncharacterized protein n=1 Tax=Portunus trituberculatus TaxID=210409 RepID=A0A5B7G6I2_PORTR|nr:hypothetical protein [Portunus trituberculatus]
MGPPCSQNPNITSIRRARCKRRWQRPVKCTCYLFFFPFHPVVRKSYTCGSHDNHLGPDASSIFSVGATEGNYKDTVNGHTDTQLSMAPRMPGTSGERLMQAERW